MANKKRLTLKEVFLGENEISRLYGLDKSTPKGVYVPDTTKNRVIAYTGENPLGEMSSDEEDLAGVQHQLDTAEWEMPGIPSGEGEIEWGDFEPQQRRQDEEVSECGCGEPVGPHIHRVGAPGGPNFAHHGGVDGEVEEPRVVLFDVEDGTYEEGSVYGTGGPSKEGSVMLSDDEKLAGHSSVDLAKWELEHDEDEERARAAEEEHAGRHEKYGSSWKPRHEGARVSEQFGDVADDSWLEIG